MAYMNQEKKAKIAAALKAVVPADWKYSLGVKNHSTIVLTIRSAPVDLLAAYNESCDDGTTKPRTYAQVNNYHPGNAFSGDLLATVEKIIAALNLDNHDRSDIQSDYFDVGHYVDLNIGQWNKPFVVMA